MRTARFVLVFVGAMASLAACPHASTGQNGSGGGPTTPASAQARTELEAAKEKAHNGDPSAKSDLERIEQQYPQTDVAAEAAFQEAEMAYQAKDYANARDKYRAVLQQYPLLPEGDLAKYHLGQSLLALDNYRDALETLSPLYDKLPGDQKLEAADSLSKAAVGAHDWAEAVRFLAEAGKGTTDPTAQAQLQQKLTDLVDSQVPQLEIARLAQELKPDSPAYALVLFKLARIAFHLHNWDQLKTTLQTLQQNAPQNPFAAEAQQMLDRVQRREQVKPDSIGVLLPLSGKYQAFGEATLAGIKLALENSKSVKLVIKDTAGDPDKAKRAVEELILDNQVIAIIGPELPSDAEASATLADEFGVPILTMTKDEHITSRGPYVFRNMLTNKAQAAALVDYTTKVLGYHNYGVLYPNVSWGVELANDFWDSVVDSGGEIHGAETYDHDQTTFSPVVKKLVGRYFLEDRTDYLKERSELVSQVKDPYQQRTKQEKLRRGLKPVIDFDALFIPDQQRNVGLLAPALAVEDVITNACDQRDLERIAKTLGYTKTKDVKTVLLLGTSTWDDPNLVERGGKFVQCSIFVDGFYANSSRVGTQKFVKAFTEANGKAPNLLSAYGYDSGELVKAVIAQSKPTTRDAFREGLTKIKNLPGAGGPINVNGHNEAEHPMFFLTIDRNGIKEFDAAKELAQAKSDG